VPNFFPPFGPMKGLHGYLPEYKVQRACLVQNYGTLFLSSMIRSSSFLLHSLGTVLEPPLLNR